MKLRNIFGVLMIGLLIVACRNNNDDQLQNIDQTLDFYIQNAAGKDMLVPGDSTGYAGNISLLDLNAAQYQKPITGQTFAADPTSGKNFMQYIGGATKLVLDSTSPKQKTYKSDFLILTKTGLNKAVADTNTIHITYSWTPSLFQVSTVSYNGNLLFSKIQGQPNNVVITK